MDIFSPWRYAARKPDPTGATGRLSGLTSRTAVYAIRTYGGLGGPPDWGRSYPDRLKIDLASLRIVRDTVHMKTITYTAARENLATTMQRACEDHDPVVITRRRDQAVVMMSMEDYASLEETAYLLRSPKNARRLREAVDQLRSGNGSEHELPEL